MTRTGWVWEAPVSQRWSTGRAAEGWEVSLVIVPISSISPGRWPGGGQRRRAVIRESGPLSPTDTARLGVALLDALMTGHRLGILHRDVKPSNILLTTPEPQVPDSAQLGRILLSDYGISLQRDVGEARLTTASGIVGTPGYLAPERARGAEPTPESDLFSLGATLYYAVEGHSPFDRSSYLATLTALLTEEPTPPSRAGDLAPVLLMLLAKDPAHRLQADDATPLLRQLTTKTLRAPQQTITEMPQPTEQPSTPQPPPATTEAPNTSSCTSSIAYDTPQHRPDCCRVARRWIWGMGRSGRTQQLSQALLQHDSDRPSEALRETRSG
ncbi:serine/threonine-protein kinase [Streptomyces sp. NPDC007896]|uniref:serine/threonine-protein kinase n=1 Tax=Streptomyces sp. NPDC007896 TaxID=3364784 RepID=UPI0036F0A2C8